MLLRKKWSKPRSSVRKKRAWRARSSVAALFATALIPGICVAHGQTLQQIQNRSGLLCGIDRSEAEYSTTDEHGAREAFDRDLCRAAAIAALGPGAKVHFTYYADDAESRRALIDGRADLIASLSPVRPDDATGDPAEKAVAYSAPILYDPVQVMVATASGITHLARLSGKKICFLTETNTEDALRDWFKEHHLDLLPFPFQEEGEMEAAYVTGNCAGLAGDSTRLAQTRAATGAHRSDYAILPEELDDDTLHLAWRKDDTAWGALLTETRRVLLAAEAAGLTQAAAANVAKPLRPLPSTIAADRVRAMLALTGNYGELFTRDVGSASELHLSEATNGAGRIAPPK